MLCAMKETNDLAVREDPNLQINKGVELMLRNKNKKEGKHPLGIGAVYGWKVKMRYPSIKCPINHF